MPPTGEDVTRAAIQEAAIRFDKYLEKITHCVDQLSDEQVWWRPHESMNSIGNLILHVTGNVRQWIVSGIGGADDVRDRPAEFSQRVTLPKARLLDELRHVVTEAKAVLAGATADEMLAERRIQGFDVTGWGAIFASVPHFEAHTQEIVCLTRIQLGETYKFHWQPRTAAEGSAQT